MRFLEVVVALVVKEFEQRRPRLTSRERRKINSRTHIYLFMKASRVVLRVVRLREEPLTYYVIRNSLGNEIWSIYNAKYSEMWTFYTPCVSVAVSGDFCHETARKCTKFKTYMFRFWAFCHERSGGSPHLETFTWQIVIPADRVTLPGRPGTPPRRVTPPII